MFELNDDKVSIEEDLHCIACSWFNTASSFLLLFFLSNLNEAVMIDGRMVVWQGVFDAATTILLSLSFWASFFVAIAL